MFCQQRDRYRLKVRASDKGTSVLFADVDVELDVVDRNNKPPLWDQNVYGPIHIKENVTVGTVVTSVKARFVCHDMTKTRDMPCRAMQCSLTLSLSYSYSIIYSLSLSLSLSLYSVCLTLLIVYYLICQCSIFTSHKQIIFLTIRILHSHVFLLLLFDFFFFKFKFLFCLFQFFN